MCLNFLSEMRYWRIIYLLLAITIWEVYSITTRIKQETPVRNFRRHITSFPQVDWELGLREATNQALLRERYMDPHLREHLFEAPLHGRQDSATLFGDIVVLARGQLYVTSDGYKFVQDPYQNDCDDCHNERNRCNRLQCETWKSHGHEQLLALWTVKRIRHRDSNFGHIFELEYTISPISKVISEGFVTRNGHFDYSVPGHIFVIKSDPRLNQAYHLNNNQQTLGYSKWYKNNQVNEQHPPPINYKLPSISNQENQDQYTIQQSGGHFKPGILIGIDSNGYKHILHSYPGFYTAYHPQTNHQKLPDQSSTTDPKEFQLYQKLIESLASKTAPPTKHHRFSINTSEKKTQKDKLTTPITVTKPTYQLVPTFKPIQETGFLQFSDDHLISTLPPTTTTQIQEQVHIITPVYVPTTISNQDITKLVTQTSPFTTHILPTQPTEFSGQHIGSYQRPQTTTFKPKPSTPPRTTITFHYYTPSDETENNLPISTIQMKHPAQVTNTVPLSQSTLPTKKPQSNKLNDITSSNHQQSTTLGHTTKGKIPIITTTEEDEDFDLFFENIPTQPMKSTTLKLPKTTTSTFKKQTTRTTMKYKKPTTPVEIEEEEEEEKEGAFDVFSGHESAELITTEIKQKKKSTKQELNKSEKYTEYLNSFSDHNPTEPMKPITEEPLKSSYPDSINEQLPPPDEDTDTTVPYVSNTVTQKTTIPNTVKSTERSTGMVHKFTTIPESTSEKTEANKINTNYGSITSSSAFTIIEPSTSTANQYAAESTNRQQTRPSFTTFTTDIYYPTTTTTTTTTTTETTEPPINSVISTTEHVKELITDITVPNEFKVTKVEEIHNFDDNKKSTTTMEPITRTTKLYSVYDIKESEMPTVTSTIQYTTTTEHINRIQDTTTEHENRIHDTTIAYVNKIHDAKTEYVNRNEDTTIEYENKIHDTTTEQEHRIHDTTTENRKKIQDTTIKYENTSPMQHTSTAKTTKSKPSIVSVVNIGDFLSDTENNNKKETDNFKNKENIDEDDIFGHDNKEISTTSIKPPKKDVIQSEFAGELFGNYRESKNIKFKSKSTTNQPKVIYSNFYAASTEIPTPSYHELTSNNLEISMEKATVYDATTNREILPLTDQSYSTSISFQVNKRNNTKITTNPTTTILHLEPTITAKLSEIMNNNSDYKIYKAELPMMMNEQYETTTNKEESKKVFDNLALQLVNHARSIDYLNKKPKTKYKRRSYKPKNKRGQQHV